VQVENWETFEQEVCQFVSDKVSTIATDSLESQKYTYHVEMIQQMLTPSYSRVREIEDVLTRFFDFMVFNSIRLIFGEAIRLKPVGNVRLDPDLGLVLLKDGAQSTIALVEVKTPKAFPLGPDLVASFREEQMKLKKLRRPRKDKVLINRSEETKASRAIAQLWGYLSVNNLKYGVLTTFNDTFFFKREFNEDQGVSRLEISRSISIGDPSVPIVGAFCYFSSLLLESHLYASPYSTPILPRKSPVKVDKYEVAQVDISQFRFGVATDFQKGTNVILGDYAPGKTALFKLLDSTKKGALVMFFTELEAYKRLDTLQGKNIPNLHHSYLMSGFLFSFVLQDCGQQISQSQFREFYEEIVKALKAIHQQGVLHGDIALRNILIDPASTKVTLIDFGLASFFGLKPDNENELSYISEKVEWDELCESELLQLESLL
jgi:serine/threonine protein kinase